MKKALIYGLSVAMLLSLAACHKPQDTQQDTSQPDPAATSSQLDTVSPEAEPSVTPELLADTQSPQELTQDELLGYFQKAYDSCISTIGTSGDIDLELEIIQELANQNNKQLPEDYAEQYKAWRPEVKEAVTFTEVNEQVWATGAVNLRSGPGTTYDKVGSLSSSQQVTRVGIGISGTEAEGWSKIDLNGSEVYVNSTYISTTKPAAQQQQQTQTNTNKQQTQTNTQQQAPQQSTQQQAPQQTQQTPKPSGDVNSSTYDYMGYGSYDAMIEALHKENPDVSIEKLKKLNPDPAKMSVDPVAQIEKELGLMTGGQS